MPLSDLSQQGVHNVVDLHSITGDPRVMRHYVDTNGRPWCQARTRRTLEQNDVLGVWDGRRLVAAGWIGVDDWLPGLAPSMGLNYYVHPDAWGRGHAGRIASALLDRAWQQQCTSIVACILAGNGGSARVATKLGMAWEVRLPYTSNDGRSWEFDVWRVNAPA